MVPEICFNKDKMLADASGGFSTATDVAEYLVGKGLPFREAHEVTGKIVRHCEKSKKELEDLSISDFKKFSRLFGPDVLKRVGVTASVSSRRSEGGTAAREVKRQISRLKRIISK
jgi:argininosuccinate lyase